MTQMKGFTIFARASTATSPYKSYNASIRKRSPSPSMSEDGQSADSSSSDHDFENSSAASSTTTVCSACSHIQKPATGSKIDFATLESIFTTANSDSSPLWYILTTALLLAFHKEKLVGELWVYLSHHMASSGQTDKDLLAAARRVREACLKASTLVGFPRAINALLALQSSISLTHPHLSAILSQDASLRGSTSLTATQKHERGLSLFTRIYAQHTSRVVTSMSSCSGGDLTHFAINSIYGELLAEDSIIGDLETGVLEFVCCLADGCAPQAKGHFFGSGNLGASPGVLRAAVEVAEEVARGVGASCPWRDGEDGEEWKFLRKVLR